MADVVVDSSVWVAAFLEEDEYHHQATQSVNELQAGEYHCHLPYLVLVETCASVARQTQKNPMAIVIRVRWSFEGWAQQGLVSWYDLNQQRTHATVDFNLALSNPLRGADSVVASLSDELGYTLKTFDNEILNRYFRATL